MLLVAVLAWFGPAPHSAAQPIVEGVRWPDVSLPVPVDLRTLPPEWQTRARAAIATWNAADARIWYVEADPAAPPPRNGVRFEPLDQLFTCGGQWQPAACTYPFVYQFAPWFISHAVVYLDASRLRADVPRSARDAIDLPALLTHELGHGLGLGEAASPTRAMFPGALWSALGEEDRRELQSLYGPADGPRQTAPPVDLTPADNTLAPPQPTLTWSPISAATGYFLQLADATVYDGLGGFADVSFGEYTVDTTTPSPGYAPPTSLTPGTTYYWRVKAQTPGGNSPWSPAARFVVGEPG